jgi:hypothetical protein
VCALVATGRTFERNHMKQFDVFVKGVSEGAYTVTARDAESAKRKVQRAIDDDTVGELTWRSVDIGFETLTGEVIES